MYGWLSQEKMTKKTVEHFSIIIYTYIENYKVIWAYYCTVGLLSFQILHKVMTQIIFQVQGSQL